MFQFVRLQVGFGLPDLTIQSLEILTLVIGEEEEFNLKFVCVEVEIFLHFLNQVVSSSLSPTNHQRLSGAVFKYLQMRTGSLKENFLLCGLLEFFKGFFSNFVIQVQNILTFEEHLKKYFRMIFKECGCIQKLYNHFLNLGKNMMKGKRIEGKK